MRPTLFFLLIVALAVPADAQQAGAQSQDPSYYFLLGRYREGKGELEQAIEAHKQAIALAPESAELRAELAALYARQDRALDSLEMAESALQRDPNNQEANRIVGSIYAAMADQRQALRPGDNAAEYPARAIAALEKARRDNTSDVGVELTLGRLYLQTGAFVKAEPILRRVVDEQPGYADGAFLLASAQEGSGKVDDAVATLERALQLNPTYYRGHLRLAELYERLQRWNDAARIFAAAQSLNPRASALTGRRAAALINAGQPAEARDLLQSLVGKDAAAADPAVLYLLAESHRALKEFDAAEATAQKLLAAHPGDTRGLHVLSSVQQERGDTKAAEQTLRQLIDKDPVDANALNSLGYMLAERGERLEEAVELLQRALKIEPANPAFLDSLGWAYFQLGKLDLADAPLSQAAARLQESSVVQDHLGDLRFKQQRYTDAAAAWERALAGDGRDIDRPTIEKKLQDARSRRDAR